MLLGSSRIILLNLRVSYSVENLICAITFILTFTLPVNPDLDILISLILSFNNDFAGTL